MKNLKKFLSLCMTAALMVCAIAGSAQTIIPKPKTKTNKTTTNHGSAGKSGNTGKKPNAGNAGVKSSATTEAERRRKAEEQRLAEEARRAETERQTKIAQAINGDIIFYDDKNNEIIYKNFRYRMMEVPDGTFLMGASDGERDEKPTHIVTLSAYRIGATEVPQWLWIAVMGTNPSNWKGDKLPVEQVSWNDCMEFINILNFKTGMKFRLPTEAEWEYAARGGRSEGTKYSGSDNINEVAWFGDNSGRRTHEVGTKRANSLGLYDMSGNVWEWCADWYGKDYYSISPQINPQGPFADRFRVMRGGGWSTDASQCRVAIRNNSSPDSPSYSLGLRLAM